MKATGATNPDAALIADLKAIALHSKLAAPVALLAAERLEALVDQQKQLAELFGVPVDMVPQVLARRLMYHGWMRGYGITL